MVWVLQSINVICIGSLKENYLISAFDEYIKRLNGLCKFNLIEINEDKLSNNPSEKEISNSLNIECEKILSKIPKGSFIICMCIEGKEISSVELSEMFSTLALTGKSNITIIIGGSYGLAESLKNQADFKLSVSKMTFPHQLFRIMLIEQIYRAFSISSNTKYHK